MHVERLKPKVLIYMYAIPPKIAADYVNKSDTFAVVVQPFMSGTKADHLPLEYLSTVSLLWTSVAYKSL